MAQPWAESKNSAHMQRRTGRWECSGCIEGGSTCQRRKERPLHRSTCQLLARVVHSAHLSIRCQAQRLPTMQLPGPAGCEATMPVFLQSTAERCSWPWSSGQRCAGSLYITAMEATKPPDACSCKTGGAFRHIILMSLGQGHCPTFLTCLCDRTAHQQHLSASV